MFDNSDRYIVRLPFIFDNKNKELVNYKNQY